MEFGALDGEELAGVAIITTVVVVMTSFQSNLTGISLAVTIGLAAMVSTLAAAGMLILFDRFGGDDPTGG